jgi:hypothetical protein
VDVGVPCCEMLISRVRDVAAFKVSWTCPYLTVGRSWFSETRPESDVTLPYLLPVCRRI